MTLETPGLLECHLRSWAWQGSYSCLCSWRECPPSYSFLQRLFSSEKPSTALVVLAMVLCCFRPPEADQNGAVTLAKAEVFLPVVPNPIPVAADVASVAESSGLVVPPWVQGNNSSRGPDLLNTLKSTGEGYDRNLNTTHVSDVLRLNLREVKSVLQKLASVNTTPTIALNEAAEVLCKHLSVSLVSITGLTDANSTYVMLAAYGTGASELEKTPVMSGPDWSMARLLEQPLSLHCAVHKADEAVNLPVDFKALYDSAGLKSFLSVPIGTEHEVFGALTIAKEDSDAFAVDWWEPLLGCLAVGLLVYLRTEHTSQLCALMKALDASTDHSMLVHQLLIGAHKLLLKTSNIRTGCRLALLNADVTKALVFECESKFSGEANPSVVLMGQMQNIHVAEIALENTLLLDAVQKGKARFVSDCASYIQSCMKPATDIFISGHDMVASIVVLPLTYEGVTFGGFYVTLEVTSNFQNIKDLLMGFVNVVVLVLQKRIGAQRAVIWDTILTAQGPLKVPSLPATGEQQEGQTNSADEPGKSADSESTTSIQAKPIVVKRSCTEAMLKVLQHEIRKTHAKSQQLEWIEELQLTEVVGKGGFGVVYKGTWKGSVAAVKVMYARQQERQAMKDALEMAVLTTVSHPNIIQVYNCFADMVEDATGSNQPVQVEQKVNVRFRRLQPDEDRGLATCNVLVMEYCDRASLRHAMKKGVFHKRLGNSSVAVDLCAIVQVLIEVAQAVQHLHNMKLIHCDIKPENVLLKTDVSKQIGFVTKLSDFGLTKLLRENYYIVNRSGSGTVTHLAPELFQVGSKLTTAVDAFSFGIMMWELYTGQRAYGGLGRDAIIDRVYKKRTRPIFPLGVPPMYASLAKGCWDDDPAARPPFGTVLSKLNEMLVVFQTANATAPLAVPSVPVPLKGEEDQT